MNNSVDASVGRVLEQIRDAHQNYVGFGKTGEFTLAQLEGNTMVFLLNHRHAEQGLPQPIGFNSTLAEPMRRSLSGQSGTVIGLDYRGETVLAAYEPVSELNWGIVAKIDLVEVQAPFIRAGIMAGLSAIVIIILGALLFLQITTPLFKQLEENEQRFRGTFEQAAVGMAHATPDGHLTMLNQRLCDILGYAQNELLGCTFQEITHPDDLTQSLEYKEQLVTGEIQSFVLEKRYLRKDGSPVWVESTVSLVREPSGKPKYLLRVVEDVTARKELEEKIQHMAYHDSLTGLPNRMLFSDRLDIALAQAKRNTQKVGVVMLDLDNFKHVNDTLGHDVGDSLLKAAAKRLSEILRESDTVARFGGDEFVLIFSGAEQIEVLTQVGQKVIESFHKPFFINTHRLVVRTSVGVAVYPNDGEDEFTLLKNADIAMYQAKYAGGGRYQFYKKASNI